MVYSLAAMPLLHDDVIKWKHFPHYWPFVRGIHQSPVNSPHKGQWRRASMFSLICAWINGWVKNREAADSRRHRVHYDVIVMWKIWWLITHSNKILNEIWVRSRRCSCLVTWFCYQMIAAMIAAPSWSDPHNDFQSWKYIIKCHLQKYHVFGMGLKVLIKHTMDMLWEKFQWILPLYMKPISFQSKA